MEKNLKTHEALMDAVIREEWRQFDLVQNEGGRASCQDNWETFRIMRTAQFRSWPEPLLESYLDDLREAAENGWNLLTEKYARMMESTAPEEYEHLKNRLPYRSPERLARQEKIIAMHVAWDEEFRAEYPRYARRGRRIRTSEDTPYATSSETYFRGELTTYSDRTFALYESWMEELKAAGKNIAAMTAEDMVREYGYGSVAELEAGL
ncbi:MAG: DUF4125 family protein [Mogibacterium sp.]|nr:DUF4125 family protein [Mogibacterium sp.]